MLKKITYVIAAMSLFVLPASADEAPENLTEWVTQANQLVDRYMRFPSLPQMVQHRIGANSYQVTINRQGEVLDYTRIAAADIAQFDRATVATINRVDFPELPANYAPDKLSFVLGVFYASTEYELRTLYRKMGRQKEGDVKVTEIALLAPENQVTGRKPDSEDS